MTSDRSVHACTIIAKNYVAFARTLCDSFLEHHPSGTFYTVIVDDSAGYIDPAKERFEIIPLDLLDIPDLRDFCFKYSVTELSTAVKPYALKYLLDVRQLEKVLYLDPDILVTGPLEGLYRLLDSHDIVVTPHLDRDFPDDGLEPDDAHIMLSGIFNLGFIGVRRSDNAGRFLHWWQHKLYTKCVVDHSAGYFVDQKFVEYGFTLFRNIAMVPDTGYNAAYWNLHSRAITYRDGTWMCNDGRLFFYHFSNYKPERPLSISGYQTRFDLAELPDLRRLFTMYRDLLIRNGYEESRTWPYSHADFRNFRELRQVTSRSYRGYARKVNLETLFSFKRYPLYFRTLRKRLAASISDMLNRKRQ